MRLVALVALAALIATVSTAHAKDATWYVYTTDMPGCLQGRAIGSENPTVFERTLDEYGLRYREKVVADPDGSIDMLIVTWILGGKKQIISWFPSEFRCAVGKLVIDRLSAPDSASGG